MLGIAKAAYAEAWEAAPPKRMPAPCVARKPVIEIDRDFAPSEAPAPGM